MFLNLSSFRSHAMMKVMTWMATFGSLVDLVSCSGMRSSSAGGEVTGVGGASFAEPTH